ncbi:MAG TPA: L-fucose mutarotase [Bacillota bacterium]
MLKGIPKVISPELIKIMLEMGHGDELVLGDGNFPAVSCAQRVVRADGLNIPVLLDAILRFYPLDKYVKAPVALMAVVPGDTVQPTIWEEYRRIVAKYDSQAAGFEFVERFAFYERAKKAFAIVATGEEALYANVILRKGVVA